MIISIVTLSHGKANNQMSAIHWSGSTFKLQTSLIRTQGTSHGEPPREGKVKRKLFIVCIEQKMKEIIKDRLTS